MLTDAGGKFLQRILVKGLARVGGRFNQPINWQVAGFGLRLNYGGHGKISFGGWSSVNAWADTSGAPARLSSGLAAEGSQKRLVVALGAQIPLPHPGQLLVLAFQRGEREKLLLVIAEARIPLDSEIVVAPVVGIEREFVPFAA